MEHVRLHAPTDGQEHVVELDFLGKDSIRYKNHVTVEKLVSALTSVTVFTVGSLSEPGRATAMCSGLVHFPVSPMAVSGSRTARAYTHTHICTHMLVHKHTQCVHTHTRTGTHVHAHIHTHPYYKCLGGMKSKVWVLKRKENNLSCLSPLPLVPGVPWLCLPL